MTQRRVKTSFQSFLRDHGVEVVEFDFLTPECVAEYCYDRGFMQLLWECGGMLAAPAIAGHAIHKLMAFVAPKVVCVCGGGCVVYVCWCLLDSFLLCLFDYIVIHHIIIQPHHIHHHHHYSQIGGPRAPTPVGELGFVEMTQALELTDTQWQQVGPDLLMTGYLPCSGGLSALADRAAAVSKLPGLRRPVAGVGCGCGCVKTLSCIVLAPCVLPM